MKKLLIILSVLLVLGSSCTDFLSVNEKNPNQASSVPVNLVLPAALNTTSRILTQPGNFEFIYLWYGCWSISGGYSQNANLTQYNLLNSAYQGDWNNSYIALQNYDYVEKNSSDPTLKSFRAIAKIMKVLHYQTLVDIYGNIPYSESLQAPAIIKPAYDNQQDIYENLVVQLDTAMALLGNLSANDQNPGQYDIIYNGDMTLWWKFANTLKLRMLVNQSGMTGRDSYITTALATTAHTTDDYLGAGEGALLNPGYLKSAGKMNPFYERFYKQDDSQQADGIGYYAANQDACSFLSNNNDPRKLLIFAPYSGTSIAGNYYGAATLLSPSNCSKLGTGQIKTFDADSPILTDFESLLLQAEAAERGYITGSVKSLYESAVTQSILYLGGNSTAAISYLAQTSLDLVNIDSTSNKLRAIITQKWIALNGISPLPIWTDFRRTGYPDFIHWTADGATLNPTPPVRLLYPQTEISTNNDNVVKQGTINLFTSKIFWQNR